jgi:UDP-3-O-[3-hydroxymyristoyl] glucosamine N-acyltransferase
MRVRELADWLGATFEGDGEKRLARAAPIDTAGAEDLAFAAGRKAVEQAERSAAGCLIVPPEYPNQAGRTVIRAPEPRTAFARAAARLHPPRPARPGVHPSAVIEPGAEISSTAEVGPLCSVGEGSNIGARCRIGAGSAIGRRVSIGDGSVLHANVTIYDDVEIGRRAVLHSGCVIGADGFGFALAGDRYEKFPQIGRVSIGDDVEIGANSCIDRAALGVTWIGDGTKLDNMVHVAHNCRIGRHVVVAAQTGFSGGVVVEDYAVIGGQVGIGDKARIESRAVLGSGCGVLTSKIVRSGQVVWGVPARPLREYLELLANLGRLPELRKEFEALRARLDALEAKHADRRRRE